MPNILFDLDGTLVDSKPGIVASTRHAMQALAQPLPTEEQVGAYIGLPLRAMFKALLGTERADAVEAAVGHYRTYYAEQGLFQVAVYPGVEAALTALQAAGAVLYVATAKPTVYARKVIAHIGLTSSFKEVYGAELDGRRTQKADLIHHLLAQEGCRPAQTVMIGDRAADMEGALANDIRSVGAAWGYGTIDALLSAGADRICKTPQALVQHVLEQG